jgi:hypothetical protein
MWLSAWSCPGGLDNELITLASDRADGSPGERGGRDRGASARGIPCPQRGALLRKALAGEYYSSLLEYYRAARGINEPVADLTLVKPR